MENYVIIIIVDGGDDVFIKYTFVTGWIIWIQVIMRIWSRLSYTWYNSLLMLYDLITMQKWGDENMMFMIQ